MRNKKELRDLIVDGQLEDAAKSSLEYAEATTDIEAIIPHGVRFCAND